MKWGNGPCRNLAKRDPGEEMASTKALRQQCVGMCEKQPHGQHRHKRRDKMR